MELPPPKKSVIISVRIPDSTRAMLKKQRPWEDLGHSSMNAWMYSMIHEALDLKKAPISTRHRWLLEDPMPRAGRL